MQETQPVTTEVDESNPDINFFNLRPSNSSHAANQKLETKDEPDSIPCKPSPKFIPSDLYYDMTGEKYVIIFNHYEYENTKYFNYKVPRSRNGTYSDVKTIQSTFGKLGFKVTTHNDLKFHQIAEIIQKVSHCDHSRTSCLVVVILTHGRAGGELYAADRPYELKEITKRLENGDIGLVTTPKLLFIQACRGSELDAGRAIQYDGESSNLMLVSSHIDFLIMQSSVEDYISWREQSGSWLIQELCSTINEHHKELDILQMITLTNRSVSYCRSSVTNKSKTNLKKQTPETRFTLTKLLKF